MNSMRRELAVPGTLGHTYGCHSDTANLLSKNLLCQKDTMPIMTNIITVLKWVRNNHAYSADLVENNMNRPPLPCKTRRNSNINTIEEFQKNGSKDVECESCLHWYHVKCGDLSDD